MADWFETRFREAAEPAGLDPAFAARMRALVLDEWGTPARRGTETQKIDLDTDAGPEEVIMLETEDRPATGDPEPPRRRLPTRWLMAAAAVVLVALAAALLVDDGDETDTATAEPVPPAKEVPQGDDFQPLEPGWWFVDPDGDPATPLRVSFQVAADGWESWLGTVKFGPQTHTVLTTMTVDNLTTDACTDHSPADPPVGPTVDDLATALTELNPFDVTSPPSDVTVDGYEGKHVRLAVPELRTSPDGSFVECVGGNLETWFSPLHDFGNAPYFGYDPDHVEDYWILDVDGTRIVLVAQAAADAPAADVAELEAIVDSIRIAP